MEGAPKLVPRCSGKWSSEGVRQYETFASIETYRQPHKVRAFFVPIDFPHGGHLRWVQMSQSFGGIPERRAMSIRLPKLSESSENQGIL